MINSKFSNKIQSKFENKILSKLEKEIQNNNQSYVWIFLPEKLTPVVAGRITKENNLYYFTYGQNYLNSPESIALSPFELALKPGDQYPEGMNTIHSCLRDAGPDAWGRRLIDYKYGTLHHNEIDYLLLSGSNRIGALDFQDSSTEYLARETKNVSLEDLLQVAELVQKNKAIPKELDYALIRGTSVGGARPKALLYDKNKEYIAKFGLSHDTFNPIKAEFIGMQLATLVGIQVPEVRLHKTLGKDILIIERFDRQYITKEGSRQYGVTRRLMLSGLSILKLNEMEARYASYINLAEVIRQRFENPKSQLKELYKRLIFNILIGNTDDHARNHSAFWDGQKLELTPAYDLCPQARIGQEATQAMAIEGKDGNFSTLANVRSVSDHFQLTKITAKELIEKMVNDIEQNWDAVCENADIAKADKMKLWQKTILNPFCFQGWR